MSTLAFTTILSDRAMNGRPLHTDLNVRPPKFQIEGLSFWYGASQALFDINCAMCHGLPQQPTPVVAKGMFPKPPQLFQADEMVADDPPGVTYWKVKNGIRLTGMPDRRSRKSISNRTRSDW
jgi:hypothetical protein